MTRQHPHPGEGRGRLLTFRSGGWVLLIAAALTLLVLAWGLAGVFFGEGESPFAAGGGDVESYGFDLSPLLVDRELLAAGQGTQKDSIEALVDPPLITAEEADRLTEEQRGKFLVSSDRVIGVTINGESVAYPIRSLHVHEIVNDTIGGVPVAVTYNGLCDSVAVFDRRVGGETRTFGVSGLLYNSNLLMYDRRGGDNEPHAVPGGSESRPAESLWSQLQARAISGRAAEARLQLDTLPCAVMRWADWRALHPDTHVLTQHPDPDRIKYYDRRTYEPYFSRGKVRFPVKPMPPDTSADPFTRVVAVRVNDGTHVYTLDSIGKRADETGQWVTMMGGEAHRFTFHDDPPTVRVTDDTGQPAPVIYALWFAWYATHPGAALE